ncbi:structural maintenance of chromosomes protein 1A-like isoform X2 [Cloeon dipterum]|uniref:structural maintenance of chromosomes protein 1A-like isoform X2 n=1 Tax=Cloeon dipterum TaxID=197152 RepID=UPI0032200003
MPAFLKYITMDNFKSYRGSQKIGPLKPFTAVIGPNGSGKSNFMDAISFVMGEKTSCLRVKRLSELIHGASVGKPVSRSASVTAIFELEDGTEKSFSRVVLGSSSENRINEETVSSQQYLSELEMLGINTKAKNFLVFQGAVESIALKNPKERTALFEEISRSGTLKEEYDRLKVEVSQAEADTQHTYNKKRNIALERKEAKMENEEAEKYQRLKDELAEKQVELALFRLYHNEKDIEVITDELQTQQQVVQRIEQSKEGKEEELKEKKKEQGKIGREMAKTEQEIREIETEINKKRPMFIKAKEKVAHHQKKLETAKNLMAQSKKAYDAHMEDIAELERELAEVEKKRMDYEETIAGESQQQGKELNLEEDQMNQYHRLKEEAGRQSALHLQELDSVNREQKSDQDRLDNEYRRKTEIENRLKQKGHEIDEAEKRIKKLGEHIRSSESALEEQRRLRRELESDVGSSKHKVTDLQRDLENVAEQLDEAHVDKHEEARRKKKQEIVENFKRLYPGVFDRMINMCQPIHKRYNMCVTKVLGKFMEAIVVDTENTARQCIQYLKEQMLEPETFLPLDYIQAKNLKERLRNIQEPKNVKLLYDVLQYDPSDIKRVVLFATNNALVCESPDDAMKVAYEMQDGQRYDAVALDGTYYQKSGMISGGSLDLARKAKRWDEKHLSNLKSEKERLIKELRQTMKKSRKESELTTVESQIKGLETRLKYSKNDLENTSCQIQVIQQEIKQLKQNLNCFEPNITIIENKMRKRNVEIEKIKENMNNVEDIVFREFCVQIGVKNIRQYEERELRTQQERAKKRLEFENQKNRIQNQLAFEKTRDTESNMRRWERAVQDDEDALEKARQAEGVQLAVIDKDMKDMDKLKNERLNKKVDYDRLEEDIGKMRREVGVVAKEILTAQRQASILESKIEQKKGERHSILTQCKMEDIPIPMLRGNMEDIGGPEANRIKIDYGALRSQYKDLVDPDDKKKMENSLGKKLNECIANIQKINAPNLKAMQKLDMAREKLQETDKEFENVRKKARKTKQAFERVKAERYKHFMDCFQLVSDRIDGIYKLPASAVLRAR